VPRSRFTGKQQITAPIKRSAATTDRISTAVLLVRIEIVRHFTVVQPNATLTLHRNFGSVTSKVIHLECSFVWH